eukprot:TRINITY_DN228_c0_g1_i2.p1 TRINITY_DN228_c0_g1~~TRINITY_DN228_c0_g1_i2.p1  ORF type:complete len:1069 (-),score=229.14 TRINITY_DN228_c0_g1_i2:344-3310(-)
MAELGGLSSIIEGLDTSTAKGLSSEEASSGFTERIEVFSTNTTPPAPFKSFWRLFFGCLEDETIIILSIAAAVSLVLGVTLAHGDEAEVGWVEGVAIMIAIMIVGTVTAVNEYQKERQFRKLNDTKNDKPVKVTRSGKSAEVSIYEIQAGDIINLFTGDSIPADGIFLHGHDLKTDESAMTGEINEIPKTENSLMLSGCQVSSGSGSMLATCVGVYSEWGATLSKLTEERDPTPLQEALDATAKTIGQIGMGVAILTFAALMIVWGVGISSTGFSVDRLIDIVGFFIIAVTIVVVAVPEGLPLAVTIALAYSMKKMLKEYNLVRHLDACETMGGATNICSDKTGTLTQNVMTVVEAFVVDRPSTVVPTGGSLNPLLLTVINEHVAVNSTAFVQARNPQKDDGPVAGGDSKQSTQVQEFVAKEVDIMTTELAHTKVVGSKTEGALLFFAKALGSNYLNVRQANPAYKMWVFNAQRKTMCSIIKKSDTLYRVFSKGASEIVLKKCTKVFGENGPREMDGALRLQIEQQVDHMASAGLRTLVLAYRDFATDEQWNEQEPPPENDLTFCVLVGIKDPVRPEVPDAVQRCKDAGITVRMVTGDNIKTAKFIARECHILDESQGHLAMEGPVFRGLPRKELDAILPRLRVLARSSPSDKHLIVSRLRELGEVVAVTGDGTNDAPALKVADVGLAMGIAGTEVAKEASDIVIMNDNFSTIVSAVKWGRGVYDNIRKFLQFQLTVNVVALIVAFISAVSQRGTPLTAVQLLWVNLIMDTLAALALGTEEPDESVLKRKPYGRTQPLINSLMWRHILGHAIFQAIILFGILYLGQYIWAVEEGSRRHYTFVFNVFVLSQLFNEFNSRKVNNEINVFAGLHTSPLFIFVVIMTLGGQIVLVTFGGNFLKCEAMSVIEFVTCTGIASFGLVIGFVLRFVPVKTLKNKDIGPPPVLNLDMAVDAELEAEDSDGEEDLGDEAALIDGSAGKKSDLVIEALV